MELRTADEATRIARDRLSYRAWGGSLDPDQFAAFEAGLRAHPWSRSNLTTWLLCDGDDVLASCETYRLDGWLDAVPGDCYGVASVFVDEPLRHRGHASRLMALLDGALRQRRPAPLAAVLFSDVGAALYEPSGYRACPAVDLVLAPDAGDAEAEVDGLLDDAALARALARRVPDGRFAIAPGPAQVDWHRERERIRAPFYGRTSLPCAGARAGGGVIAWAASWHDRRLLVLLLDGAREDEAAALVRAARRVAARHQLAEVRVWEEPWPFPSGDVFADAERVPRPGALPMIAPFAPALTPARWQRIPRAVWL